MKRVLIIVLIVCAGFQSFGQPVSESTRKKVSAVFDVFNDFYLDVPDSIDNKFFNLGVNFDMLYDFQIAESNFSFAIGAGIGSHNFYSNAFVVEDSLNVSALYPIKSLHPGTSYKKNKISYTYFDVPLEFRLRTKKNFRAAVGFKVGFLIDNHSKYRGDDYIFGTTDKIHVKFKDVPNIEKLRYGVTARVGWKFINLMGFYSLTDLFTKDKGSETYPISIGISLMPF
ncbi:MAG: porin family protein [Bacteroidales bacterium]|nr:PorT family protein [Bacteroidales bacterium]